MARMAFPIGTLFPLADLKHLARDHRIESTGEFRPPKRDEWYLSGAIPEGYKAIGDYENPHWIGRLVKVRIRAAQAVKVEL